MCHDKSEYRISADELKTRLKFNSIRECFRKEHSGLVK